MIDNLVLKAHLKDYFLTPHLYLDEYQKEGRGEFLLFDHELGDFRLLPTFEDYQQAKASTPDLVHFRPQIFTLLELGIPLSGGIKPMRKANGDYDSQRFEVEQLKKLWEKIESSYSGLPFKLFDARDDLGAVNLHCPVYIEFHASPAKIKQGHNIFGSDDIVEAKDILLDVLLTAYPQLSKFFDFDNLYLSSLDVTYFSRANSQEEAELFNLAIKDISRGQTKSRNGFYGTAYFGSTKSAKKKLKCYCKYIETMDALKALTLGIQRAIKRVTKQTCPSGDIDIHNSVIPLNKIKDYNLLKIYTPELIEFTQGMIRWEATLKSDWLTRRDYSLNFNTFITQFEAQKLWQDAFKDLFSLLESKTMTITDYSEANIKAQLCEHFVTHDKHGKPRYSNALNAYKTFLLIKRCGFLAAMENFRTVRGGLHLNNTWYRHLEMFRDIGLTDIYLQNFKNGEDSSAKVVPLLIFSTVDFSAQFPKFYKAA